MRSLRCLLETKKSKKILDKAKKKKKRIASIYEIAEDEKENAENSDNNDTEKLSEDTEAVAIPYPPIFSRAMADMNHAEAQEETGNALMLMFQNVRQQTDHL